MAAFKCKMCGGNLDLEDGVTVVECEYCGTKQTVPSADNEKKMALFTRANKLRFSCEFDKAAGVYESIVVDFPEEAEAYWGLVLCKYGIEYVDDPGTGKKIPTCHRSSFDSVMDDGNFDLVMENADPIACSVYREEAKQIEALRKGIVEVSSKEEPYDIFICYKETDEHGDRTVDSLIAQEVYDALTENGYRVFFSRITLEDKLGAAYEPYIFAALNSAKIMLAFGTSYQYYNAVWVKNEWSRFLHLIAKGEKKTLIPCYKGIDAYDIPKEFAHLQAQDMGKVGAIQDLLRGIEKILPKKVEKVKTETVVVQQSAQSAAIEPLLRRAFMFLEDGEWESANEYCEKVLDMDPENVQAYLGKLMAELKSKRQKDLKDCSTTFINNDNYQKILRYADTDLVIELKNYNKYIYDRNISDSYNRALAQMNAKQYALAAQTFKSILGYKDADELAKQCLNAEEDARKDEIYAKAEKSERDIGLFLKNPKIVDISKKRETVSASINQLASISGWKNADSLIRSFEQKLEKLNELDAVCSRLLSLKNKKNECIDRLNQYNKIRGLSVFFFVVFLVAFCVITKMAVNDAEYTSLASLFALPVIIMVIYFIVHIVQSFRRKSECETIKQIDEEYNKVLKQWNDKIRKQ